MALKNELLTLLESSRGTPLSGTALAERFGVSRNAVWKAVTALKDEGHMIETAGKKGYLLSKESDRLSEETVRAHLGGGYEDLRLFVYDRVGSTNDEAARFLSVDKSSRAVFIADRQSEGRGRFGRSFYSPAGTGLYLSAVLRPDKPLGEAVMYTAAAAVAVSRAIKKTAGVRTGIKWINDLYIGRRKVCGILSEATADFETGQVRSMIVGIGINVTTDSFPAELKDKAVSLGSSLPRSLLAAEIIKELYSLTTAEQSDFMDEYRQRSFLIGKEVGFFDGREHFRGRVTGIGDRCELLLITEKGAIAFSHGEITDL